MTTTFPAVSADPIWVPMHAIHAVADGDSADFGPCTIRAPSTTTTRLSRHRRGFRTRRLRHRAVAAHRVRRPALRVRHAIADPTVVAVNSTMNSGT